MFIKSLVLITLSIIINFSCLAQKKKALLIGIDGLQYEQIALNNAPNIQSFNIKKGFTGGVYGSPSEQSTSSSPGWMSILTGVWYDKHDIKYNTEEKLCKAPSLFKIIKEHIDDSYVTSISTWNGLNLLLKHEMHEINFATIGGTDILSTKLTIDLITDEAPDFAFIQLDEIDTIGHANGFGNNYSKKIEDTDLLIGNLLNVIKKREVDFNEDWLVIIVTDHGRGEKGKVHGGQTISEKTIFIGMNKKGNNYFNSNDNNKEILSLKDLETLLPQTAIMPTILKHLGVTIDTTWSLDTKSLLD